MLPSFIRYCKCSQSLCTATPFHIDIAMGNWQRPEWTPPPDRPQRPCHTCARPYNATNACPGTYLHVSRRSGPWVVYGVAGRLAGSSPDPCTPHAVQAIPDAHTHPGAAYHQTMLGHVPMCGTPPRVVGANGAADRPAGRARNPTAQASPTQVLYPAWAPGLTTHAPGCSLPPNHVQACIYVWYVR